MADKVRYIKICMFCQEIYGCISKDGTDERSCDTCSDMNSCILHGFEINQPKTCKECPDVWRCTRDVICSSFDNDWSRCKDCKNSTFCKNLQGARGKEARRAHNIMIASHGYCSTGCQETIQPSSTIEDWLKRHGST